MRRYRRRSRSQYLLPFILVISLGIFLVLVFQLWGNLFPTVKGDALFYVADGRSKVLPFGTSEWENIYNGSKVKLGDSVKTLHNAKGVLQFYDGTVVRLNEDTQITLVDITVKNDSQQIILFLNEGDAWINKPKQNVVKKTNFIINTNFASYTDTGTVFNLAKHEDEILTVVKGQVKADILENKDGKTRVIESVLAGIGQQLTLNDLVMQEFYQRKFVSVLTATNPIFQTSNWYLWNIKEDDNPTDFSKLNSESTITENSGTPENSLLFDGESSNQPKSSLNAPTLLSPKSNNISAVKDTQELSGKVAEGTKKLLLKQLLAGDMEVQKILVNTMDVDSLTWSYTLSDKKGNMKVGKNVYEFVGIDENAKETEPLRVVIEYQALSEPDLVIDNTELTKPVVLTVNGASYQSGMQIDKNAFSITGSVSNMVDQVWVDDFQLTKFKKGDATWTYNVNTSFGNLKNGENTYNVYGMVENGKKTPIQTIKINYIPKVKEEVSKPVEEEKNDVSVEQTPKKEVNNNEELKLPAVEENANIEGQKLLDNNLDGHSQNDIENIIE